jgi:hypothetical protein
MNKVLFATAITDYKSTDVEGAGQLRWVGDKCYRWMKNGEAATAWVAGQPVCGKGADYGDIHKIAYIPVTAQLMFLKGIAMSAVPATYFGWVQVHGYYASVMVKNASGTTYTIGCYLKGLDQSTGMTFDGATQAAYKRNVQVLESVATVTTTLIAIAATKCVINCLD